MPDRPVRPVQILLVDRNPAFLDMMAALLERADDHVSIETATSGQAALDHLAKADVECILSAYGMPEMTGIDLASAVTETAPDVSFVLVSNADPTALPSARTDGAIDARYRKLTAVENYPAVARRIHDLVRNAPADRIGRPITPER